MLGIKCGQFPKSECLSDTLGQEQIGKKTQQKQETQPIFPKSITKQFCLQVGGRQHLS